MSADSSNALATSHASQTVCDLCGLPLTQGRFGLPSPYEDLSFCCPGCSMVYTMLVEAEGDRDPAGFKKSDLYKRCVAAGVIPQTAADQARIGLDRGRQAPLTLPTENPSAPAKNRIALDLVLTGMWCPACAWVVEAALTRQAGVLDAACRFATDRLRVGYDPIQTSPEALMDTIVPRPKAADAPLSASSSAPFSA
ncbi:MAG: hypothetical protein P8010_00130 [Desulfosarcinaceae bacterium]